MIKAIDESKLSMRLLKAGMRLEKHGDYFEVYSGAQIVLARGSAGEPLTLQQIDDVTMRISPTLVDATSRRRFLSTAATLAAGGAALALPIPLAAAAEPDPIYAAIERHKEAAAVWDAAVDVWAKFAEGPTPMPIERRIERERINDAWRAARDAMDDTGVDLINTAPTTLGGIARALNYVREQMLKDDGIYMPGDLRLADDTDGEYPVAWIEAFVDTIEHAARELDRAGKAVA